MPSIDGIPYPQDNPSPNPPATSRRTKCVGHRSAMGAPRSATSPLRPIVTSPRYCRPCNGKCGASQPHPPFLFGTTAVSPPVSRQVAPVLSAARMQYPPQSAPYAAITRHPRVADPKTNAKDHRPVCCCNTATTAFKPKGNP